MSDMDERVDSITRQVRKMRPKRYTTRDAAKIINRSTDTLRRWRVTGEFVPTDKVTFGETTVFLYTSDDIKALKKVAKAQRPGPKAKDNTRRNNAQGTTAKRKPARTIGKRVVARKRAAAR